VSFETGDHDFGDLHPRFGCRLGLAFTRERCRGERIDLAGGELGLGWGLLLGGRGLRLGGRALGRWGLLRCRLLGQRRLTCKQCQTHQGQSCREAWGGASHQINRDARLRRKCC
jgi:hypothetical protein